jgi:hypothetical protein
MNPALELALILLGIGALFVAALAIAAVYGAGQASRAEELRPPIDDTYVVDGEDDLGTPWCVPTKPDPRGSGGGPPAV